MFLERWFHLLEYLTLGLSCSALVLAEAPFLPDLQILLAPVLALLLLSWWAEGRWSLPNRGADVLAVLIVAGGVYWVRLHRHDKDLVLTQLPFHLALLPYLGPLLIAALLVKVFRTRDPSHFWATQGIGLLQIALGCMLEGGPMFGVALAAYLASLLACLSLHYRLSTLRPPLFAKDKGNQRLAGGGPRTAESGRWLLAFTPRWALLIAVPALLLFLLTPRRGSWAWEPLNNYRSGQNRIRVRGSTEAMNLNTTGRLELDDEVAVEVTAANVDGQAKLDLPVEQRWRGGILDLYENGTWRRRQQTSFMQWPVFQRNLPNFGGACFLLTFRVQTRRSGGLVLAEPIRFGPPRIAHLPVLSLDDAGDRLFAVQDGTLLPATVGEERREYQYRQAVPTRADPLRAPDLPMGFPNTDLLKALPQPLGQALRSWTTLLLQRLAQQPRYRFPTGVRAAVRAAVVDPDKEWKVDEKEWEATARILTEYLAHSGDFTYSLDITRQDRSLDPILDFLVNIKKGHCERYAAALAAMLRSVGVPARIVKGFRGWDSKGGGRYILRHRHAHAWVEILVPHSGSRLQGFSAPTPYYDWLTLDPTPPATVGTVPSFSLGNLWDRVQQFCVQSYGSLIVDYNGDEQADLWESLTSGQPFAVLGKMILAVLVLGAVLAFWLFLRRLGRRSRKKATRRPAEHLTIYRRLVRLLERYASLRPSIAQTPREYGETAESALRTLPALAALAAWPRRAIELFYRVRFGEQPLRDDERQTLEEEFEHFKETLSLFSRDPRGSALASRSPAGRG